jgi:hypothetical protein
MLQPHSGSFAAAYIGKARAGGKPAEIQRFLR